MLEIIQAKDYKPYFKLFDELNISDEIVSVVEAMDNNIVTGFGIYHFTDKEVVLDYIKSDNDLNLYDGIVRSILYLAMINKINSAKFNFQDKANLVKLGFVEENVNILTSIECFMNNCKSCKKA